MTRIEQVLQNKKSLIPFLTGGDPTIAVTEELILCLAEAGADLIEIGIPFSDPIAEGPVIQAASERALKAGTTTDALFSMVERLQGKIKIPLVFMTYLNVVYTYGAERFLKRCQKLGIEGIILPDLPYEEREELLPLCKESEVTLISMIAPTSKDRIHKIAKDAEGFLYCVSSLGVTGERKELGNQAREMILEARKATKIPCAIGFGITTAEQAKKMAEFSDGVIIGSAIVQLIEEHKENSIAPVMDFVKQIKAAIYE